MAEDWPLVEKLANIAADLLSERRFEPFVRRLFATPPGVWHSVAGCCGGLAVLPPFADGVFAGHAASFVVTYLPWPGVPVGEPDVLVLFAHTEELWSTIASYNRAALGTA